VGKVKFTGANGANPTALVDEGGLVSTAVRTSEGLYTLTLRDRWVKINARAFLETSNGLYGCQAVPTAGLSAANTVVVRAWNNPGGRGSATCHWSQAATDDALKIARWRAPGTVALAAAGITSHLTQAANANSHSFTLQKDDGAGGAATTFDQIVGTATGTTAFVNTPFTIVPATDTLTSGQFLNVLLTKNGTGAAANKYDLCFTYDMDPVLDDMAGVVFHLDLDLLGN
jgi:hypothetical protein